MVLNVNIHDKMKKNLAFTLIKIVHPNYDFVDICCDKTNISECFNMDYIDPNENYVLSMYLLLMSKGVDKKFKFIKYHTYRDGAIGLMAASSFLEDINDLKKQEKGELIKKYERKNN